MNATTPRPQARTGQTSSLPQQRQPKLHTPHLQPRFSALSSPYVVLGALTQRTRRLRLGVAVNILPVNHPLHLAEQAAR